MASLTALLYIFIFVYGIVIGSFLNVCIYRIPKKESIVTVSSHCMTCNHRLTWYDLFPLFSFLFLKGRCRYCGIKLSLQYPAVEFLNGILYIVVFAVNGMNVESGLYCLLVSALLVLSVIDYQTMEIPISVNAVILGIGILHMVFDLDHWMRYVIGFFAASLFLLLCLIVTRGRGIGGGDIKLMAVAGLCVGWDNILLALVFGCIIGSVIQCIVIAYTKKKTKFAMGPYLSVGIFVAMLWGGRFLEWYIGLSGV